MKIFIGDEDNPVSVSDVYSEVTIKECFSGIGIESPMGMFGIALRDGGIEVILDGKLVWTSHEIASSEKDEKHYGADFRTIMRALSFAIADNPQNMGKSEAALMKKFIDVAKQEASITEEVIGEVRSEMRDEAYLDLPDVGVSRAKAINEIAIMRHMESERRKKDAEIKTTLDREMKVFKSYQIISHGAYRAMDNNGHEYLVSIVNIEGEDLWKLVDMAGTGAPTAGSLIYGLSALDERTAYGHTVAEALVKLHEKLSGDR